MTNAILFWKAVPKKVWLNVVLNSVIIGAVVAVVITIGG